MALTSNPEMFSFSPEPPLCGTHQVQEETQMLAGGRGSSVLLPTIGCCQVPWRTFSPPPRGAIHHPLWCPEPHGQT